MLRSTFLLVVILLLGFNFAGFSQWKMNQISGPEGLSQNTVKSIIQDKNGFIWVGTYHGINKYDGYDMTYYNYTGDEFGLSSNLIHSLFEDKDGFIWAGTSDAGLNRLNPRTGKIDKFFTSGHQSRYFRNIENLFQASNGIIFYNIKTGLRLFKVTQDGELIFEETVDAIKDVKNNIRSIIPAKNGKHWMLTPSSNIKLWLIDIEEKGNSANVVLKETGVVNRLFDKGYASTIYESDQNTIWILSNQLELLKITLNNDFKVTSKEYIELAANTDFENRNYQNLSIQADMNGKLWIAGERLLLNFDTESNKVIFLNDDINYQINHKLFQNLLVDSSNILWMGTIYNGLYNIDLDNNTFYNSSESLGITQQYYKRFHKYPLMAISEDSKGNIWLGKQGNGGLAILSHQELEQNFAKKSTKLWELNYLNSYEEFRTSNFINIRRFLHDEYDNVWVGSSGGLSLIEEGNTKSGYRVKHFNDIEDSTGKRIQSAVFSLEQDFNKVYWVGYWSEGLVKLKYDYETGDYTSENYISDPKDSLSISDNYVRDILEDSNKNLWVGTVGGLNKVVVNSKGETKFKKFLHDDENDNTLSNNHILDVYEARNGKLYIGTFGGGLNEVEILSNGELSFKHYLKKDGLPNNIIYQISEDDSGNIWMMHIRELSKLNPITGEISYFDKQDGFNINEFKDNAMLKTSSGILICGGVNGFTFFDPNKLSINNREAKLVITDFKLFDNPIKTNQKINDRVILTENINDTKYINLPHNLNSIEFVFSSLHFSNPDKNQYKYMLEGFEDKWQYSMGNDRRFASYTNLSPGDYTFKVFSSNSSGDWSENGKEIVVKIDKPWYLLPTSLLIFSLIALGLIYSFIRIKLNQVRLESQLELDSALHEKNDEINKMKLQFFTNISHELRTPLTLIIGPLQQIMKGNTDEAYLKKLNAVMYKNSVRLLKLINQLLDFRKAESGNLKLIVQHGNMVSFIDEVFKAFEEIAVEKQIKFVFVNELPELWGWFDNDKIEKILYNLLSNAFKYTPRGKSIKLVLKREEINNLQYAKIEVIDYGLGIPKDELESIFERFYRAKNEHDSIHFGSGLGLAYTKRLVELHKGEIQLESEIHQGTTCVFSIPLSKEVYDSESIMENQLQQYNFKYTKGEIQSIKEKEQVQNTVENARVHSSETPTILIVEDNSELQSYLANVLNDSYVILTADNGEEGLELALENTPSLIISDLMMPKMDGIEMCKKIKSDLKTSHIPVIILTAKAGLENEKEGLETGADEFVLKPFNTELLKLRIENILRTKQQFIQKFKTNSNTKVWKELSNKLDQKFLEKSIKIVKEHIDDTEFSVEVFANEIGMSRSALFKKVKSITGQSTSEFIRTIRIKKAAKLLRSGEYNITEVIYLIGFSDPKYFRTCFKKQFGTTPSAYISSFKAEKKTI